MTRYEVHLWKTEPVGPPDIVRGVEASDCLSAIELVMRMLHLSFVPLAWARSLTNEFDVVMRKSVHCLVEPPVIYPVYPEYETYILSID